MLFRKELVKYCHKVYEKGFVAGTDGNLSIRFSENVVLITRSAISKGDVTEDDILAGDFNGSPVYGKGKISTEVKIHIEAYKKREDVKSVIHCHPVYATSCATAGLSLDMPVFPEIVLSLGRVPLCEYATPSTPGLVESMLPYIEFANVFLLKNHGAVAFGKNLKEAFYRMEKLEHYAKSVFLMNQIGKIERITNEKLKELYSLAEKSYGIKLDKRNMYI